MDNSQLQSERTLNIKHGLFEVQVKPRQRSHYGFVFREEVGRERRDFIASVVSGTAGVLDFVLTVEEAEALADAIAWRFDPPPPSEHISDDTVIVITNLGHPRTRWIETGDQELLSFALYQQKAPGDNYTFALREGEPDYPDRFEAMVSHPARFGETGAISVGLTEQEVRHLGQAIEAQLNGGPPRSKSLN